MARTPGLGLKLPVRGGPEGYFWVCYEAIDQVKSNLTNLILTKKGERIMQPTFGCDIHELTFDQITDDLVVNVKGAIKEAVQIWMPFISVDDIQIQKDEDTNKVYLEITFSLTTTLNITETITLVI